MRYLILLPILFFTGCASVPISGYISRIDHPYDRKIYASFEKVVSTTMYVLKKKGWTIDSEVDPSIYERDERYDNNGYQNLLIMTGFRKNALSLGSMHLNVLVHSLQNVSDVEIRYEAQKSLIKQFVSVRNDQLAKDLLDSLEDEINRS